VDPKALNVWDAQVLGLNGHLIILVIQVLFKKKNMHIKQYRVLAKILQLLKNS